MSERYTGTVVWFNPKRGYGFIECTKDGVKQEDQFVHYSDLDQDGFRTLKKGQVVEYGIGENKHGKPKAIEVKIVG